MVDLGLLVEVGRVLAEIGRERCAEIPLERVVYSPSRRVV
jgi:hypothetical protein